MSPDRSSGRSAKGNRDPSWRENLVRRGDSDLRSPEGRNARSYPLATLILTAVMLIATLIGLRENKAMIAQSEQGRLHSSCWELLGEQRFCLAADCLDQLLEEDEDNPQLLLAASEAAIECGDLPRATKHLARFQVLKPHSPDSQYWLGVLRFFQEQHLEAFSRLSAAKPPPGQEDRVHLYLGIAALQLGETKIGCRELGRYWRKAKTEAPTVHEETRRFIAKACWDLSLTHPKARAAPLLRRLLGSGILLAGFGHWPEEPPERVPRASSVWIEEPPEPRAAAADTDLKGHFRSRRGPIFLDELPGDAVIVHFLASWCLPCKKELPEFLDMIDAEALNSVSATGTVTLLVTIDNFLGEGESFLRDLGYGDRALYHDPGAETLLELTGSSAIPATVLVTPHPTSVIHHVSTADWSSPQLRQQLRQLIIQLRSR